MNIQPLEHNFDNKTRPHLQITSILLQRFRSAIGYFYFSQNSDLESFLKGVQAKYVILQNVVLKIPASNPFLRS